jgi:hypothetical protein
MSTLGYVKYHNYFNNKLCQSIWQLLLDYSTTYIYKNHHKAVGISCLSVKNKYSIKVMVGYLGLMGDIGVFDMYACKKGVIEW